MGMSILSNSEYFRNFFSKTKSLMYFFFDCNFNFLTVVDFEKIIKKSRLKHVKILVIEKRFLSKKKLNTINKPIYYYTARNKKNRRKYSDKNLIFENL